VGRTAAVLRTTAVVAVLGAIGGALGGVVIAAAVTARSVVSRGVDDLALGEVLMVTGLVAGFGAAYGIVLGPALSWAFMRHVPLGRAIGETAFAAALGVGAAFVFPIGGASVLVYPVFAALLAAMRLTYVSRPAKQLSAPGSAG
jgi:hypothetical protein